MPNEVKKAFVTYALCILLGIATGFGFFQYLVNQRSIEPLTNEYTEYLDLQSARLGDIETAIRELSDLESEIRDIRGIVEGLSDYNQQSKDLTVGVGLLSDENERIINELQSRLGE